MNAKKIYNLSFALVAIFPLLNLRWATNLIIIWSILSIYVIISQKTYKTLQKTTVKEFGILSLYYLFLIGSCISSGFDKTVLKFMETGASFLIFPLLILINRDYIEQKTIHRSLIAFYLSNVILAILCWIKILNIGFLKLQEQNDFYHPVFRNLFAETTGIHLPYLGLFFVFSIFIGVLHVFKRKGNMYLNIAVLLSLLLLLMSIVTFSARMALIIGVVCSLYLFFVKLKNLQTKLIATISLLLLIIILITKTPIKKRIDEILETKLELPSSKLNDKEHQVNFRYGIYYCASKIVTDNFWWGVGKSQVGNNLDACYNTFTFSGVNDFKKVKYNSHNQYLDILMSYGIFGLLILILAIFYGVFTKPNTMYSVFLLTLFLALLTENLFERQLGVVFFAFFNSLFILKKTDEKSLST